MSDNRVNQIEERLPGITNDLILADIKYLIQLVRDQKDILDTIPTYEREIEKLNGLIDVQSDFLRDYQRRLNATHY